MTRHRLTGSRVELADAGCLYWARPDVALPSRVESAASALGSATHEAAQLAGEAIESDEDLEDVLRAAASSSWVGGDECVPVVAGKWNLTPSATEQLGELYETWLEWWQRFVPEGASVRYEVPFAWDTSAWASRELPKKGEARDYSMARWEEVTCTIDAVIVERCSECDGTALKDGVEPADCDVCHATGYGRVTVVDLKTGRRRHAPAVDHAQLATGALCVAGALGVANVRVVLAKIMPGIVLTDEAVLDTMALDGRALKLAEHVGDIPTAQPVPGAHCSGCYCPAIAVCEGPRALARRAPELAAALPVTVETEEQAAAVILAAPAMQAYVDGLKRSAIEWADRHGGRVRMPDGATMRRAAQSRRTLDGDRVHAALVGALGESTAAELVKVKRSVSVTAVERAAAALGPHGRKRADVEARDAKKAEVMRALESTGGVKVSTFSTWEREEPALTNGSK